MLYVLVGCWLVQLLYWWYAYRAAPRSTTDSSASTDAVSVLIAARNEADRIGGLLQALVDQTYPHLRAIVVDDYSTDDTEGVARRWSDRLDLTVIKITEDYPGKKHALAAGIDAATTEWILCTDADCIPHSDAWVSTMMAGRGDHVAVIGYGPLTAQPGIASWLAVGEAVWTATHYLAASAAHRAYMAVGRNFLFSKAAYLSVGGYDSHRGLASGDDDLLLSDLQRTGSIGLVLSDEAWVDSEAVPSWRAWLQQKRRHLSTATRYSPHSRRDLALFAITHLLVVGSATACMVMGHVYMVIAVLTIKYLLQGLLSYRWYAAIGQLKYWRALPIMEWSLAIFYLVLSPYLWWHKKTW